MEQDKKLILIYDFDGTLTTHPYPLYLIIEKYGYPKGTQSEEFSETQKQRSQNTKEKGIDLFTNTILGILEENGSKATMTMFNEGQERIEYNKGIENFFQRINEVARKKGIQLEHDIITSGYKEYIQNLPLRKEMTEIYGSTLKVDKEGTIQSIDIALSEVDKIESVKEINRKNGRKENDCSNMMYLGDGFTDQYAMDFIHKNGGKSILVYQPEEGREKYDKMNQENTIDWYLEANYEETGDIMKVIIEELSRIENQSRK